MVVTLDETDPNSPRVSVDPYSKSTVKLIECKDALPRLSRQDPEGFFRIYLDTANDIIRAEYFVYTKFPTDARYEKIYSGRNAAGIIKDLSLDNPRLLAEHYGWLGYELCLAEVCLKRRIGLIPLSVDQAIALASG